MTEILWTTLLKQQASLIFELCIDYSKVHRLLLNLNSRKSTGTDKIPAKIIRFASPVIANSLTKIFNRAINNESVPSEWEEARVVYPLTKKALVIFVHKKGSRYLLNNIAPYLFFLL